MALYGIADLHLSFSTDKPMDIYGPAWKNHTEVLKREWINLINEDDTVIIAGDISWGLRLNEAIMDLFWIDNLPGNKVMFKGNHDPWWSSVSKLNNISERMYFVQNDFYVYEDYAICGTRGWLCPGSSDFKTHDNKIYLREQIRLRASLEAAKKSGYKKIIGVMHFPPTNEKKENSGFVDIFNEYEVEKVIFGHLHGETKNSVPDTFYGKTEFSLVSCDALRCIPQRIL